MGEFGDQFRKAREQKKLSFDDVSRVTKINARMLKAIEEERFEQLPGGVFNKGFVRTYAKHLGLNDDDAVDDYLKLIRQTQIEANELPQPDELEPSRTKAANQPKVVPFNKRGSHVPVEVEELPDLQLPRIEHVSPGRKEFVRESDGGIPWSLVALAAVVVAGATFLYLRHSRSNRLAAAPASAPVVKAATIQAPQSTPAQPAPVKATSTPATTASKSPAPTGQVRTTSLNTIASGATTPATGTDKAPAADEPSSATPATKSSGSLRLVIRATENSWLSVLADGQTVREETLIAPAHTTIHADHEIVARIGNAAGITFQWNGQEIAAQGLEGEAKTVVFDAQGVRVVGAAPSGAIP